MRIAFLNIYIGKLPWYFLYFLHSCETNNTIDFYILTDDDKNIVHIPENVKILKYSLKDFNRAASKKLNLKINVEKAYKLCDFKPAYGIIFENLFKNYDFWGYCDIDIIWGNIRTFMTNQLLESNDIISARNDYLTGCFALYKNNKIMRELFMQSRDYKIIFNSSLNYFFDETNFAFKEFESGIHFSLIKTEVESMTHVVLKLTEQKEIKSYFEFQILEGFAGNMLWNSGRLIYRNEFEALFYHMVKFKNIYKENCNLNKLLPNKFRIGKSKLYY